eukprot:g1685.t1
MATPAAVAASAAAAHQAHAAIVASLSRSLFDFFLKAVTDLAFAPALVIVKNHKRHFELWVGVMQLVAAFLYNASDAFRTDLYLERSQWHFISDVMSITYVCMLAIHYMQLRNPDVSTALRYLAFTLAWVSKMKDGFSSQITQTIVIAGFIGWAVLRVVGGQSALAKVHRDVATRGAGLMVMASAFLAFEVASSGAKVDKILGGDVSLTVVLGVAHVLAGAGVFYLWKACPVMDMKKLDALPAYI